MNAENKNKSNLVMCAAILAVQLFVFIPVGLYFTNIDEMNIGLFEMLKLNLVPVLLLFLTVNFIGVMVPKRWQKSFVILIAASSILVWLQSNILLWDYGLLDGRLIDWNKDTWRGWVDLSLWLIILFCASRIAKKHEKIVLNAAAAVFILQLLTTGILVMQNKDSIKTDHSGSDEALESLYEFSAQKNVLHLLVDGFQSDVFNDLINFPGLGEYYRKAFSGFTYYQETMGVFPYTRFSVPAFLSGKLYSNEMPQDDFVDKVLSENNIINLAYEKGYEIDLGAGDPYLEKRYSHLKHHNLYNLDNINSTLEETVKLLDLTLFRVAPHFLKPLVYNEQKWLFSPHFSGKNGMQFKYFKHTYFLNNLITHMNADRTKPVYKYIHVMNTHNPMVVNAYCNYDGKVSPMTRETLTIQSKCTLDTIVALFEKMKALGIYDNTLIVIHGDHGGWTGNQRAGKPIKFIDGKVAPDWMASLASPMLVIKLPHQTGDIQISKKWISLSDLPDSISDMMGWDTKFGHESLLKIDEQQERVRRFRFYGWRKNEWSEKYAGPIQEFIVRGSHYESQWETGEIFFPPRK